MVPERRADLLRETFYRLNTPVRLALLTDLHERPFHSIQDSLLRHHPDIICIAGDMIYGSNAAEDSLVAKRILPVIAACASLAPTFVSIGNHEWMLGQEDLEAMAETGVTVLENRWIEWNGIRIGGFSSAAFTSYQQFRRGRPERYPKRAYLPLRRTETYQKPVPDTAWLEDYSISPCYKILLCHHPEYYPEYLKDREINLVLSGHAHGGQIRIFDRGLFAPGQGWFPKLTSGVHDERLVISRGLSNTGGIIPRLFNPREIVYIS